MCGDGRRGNPLHVWAFSPKKMAVVFHVFMHERHYLNRLILPHLFGVTVVSRGIEAHVGFHDKHAE